MIIYLVINKEIMFSVSPTQRLKEGFTVTQKVFRIFPYGLNCPTHPDLSCLVLSLVKDYEVGL